MERDEGLKDRVDMPRNYGAALVRLKIRININETHPKNALSESNQKSKVEQNKVKTTIKNGINLIMNTPRPFYFVPCLGILMFCSAPHVW